MLGFRVWDCDKKIMVSEPGNFTMNYDGSMSSFCPRTHDFGKLWGDELIRFIPMQSTGFTDKNGKLIFEGDIFQWDQGCIYLVKDTITFISDTTSWVGIDNRQFNVVTIAGNKFENPELLERIE